MIKRFYLKFKLWLNKILDGEPVPKYLSGKKD